MNKFDRNNDGVITKREVLISSASLLLGFLLSNVDVILGLFI